MHPLEMSFLYSVSPPLTMDAFLALELPEEFVVRAPLRPRSAFGKVVDGEFQAFRHRVVEDVTGNCVWVYEDEGEVCFEVFGLGNAYFPRNHGEPLMQAIAQLTGASVTEYGAPVDEWNECDGCSACRADCRNDQDLREIALRRACRAWTGGFAYNPFHELLVSKPAKMTRRQKETMEGYVEIAYGPDTRLVDGPWVTMMRAVLDSAELVIF